MFTKISTIGLKKKKNSREKYKIIHFDLRVYFRVRCVPEYTHTHGLILKVVQMCVYIQLSV